MPTFLPMRAVRTGDKDGPSGKAWLRTKLGVTRAQRLPAVEVNRSPRRAVASQRKAPGPSLGAPNKGYLRFGGASRMLLFKEEVDWAEVGPMA